MGWLAVLAGGTYLAMSFSWYAALPMPLGFFPLVLLEIPPPASSDRMESVITKEMRASAEPTKLVALHIYFPESRYATAGTLRIDQMTPSFEISS